VTRNTSSNQVSWCGINTLVYVTKQARVKLALYCLLYPVIFYRITEYNKSVHWGTFCHVQVCHCVPAN